ncbi:hypothetical protein MCNS_02950 [Mycobacterium conspicuum]|uniref:Transmembrane protein n=1 Tax=Mycobacterium conspicuum TaxID=44010 RepID=A0A7I7Y862_9MYCO|nr:hypothetical protein MCNS_02950 [Mycobacterium conspicuum]
MNGVVGGVKGAAEGIQRGIGSGSKSTAAAALAIGALGVTGLVEWPILMAVGGGALVLQRMNRKPEDPAPKAKLTTVPTEPEPAEATPSKAPSRKAAAKKASGRRAGSAALRSTN